MYRSIFRAGINSKGYTAWENDSNCSYTVVNYTIFRHVSDDLRLAMHFVFNFCLVISAQYLS